MGYSLNLGAAKRSRAKMSAALSSGAAARRGVPINLFFVTFLTLV